MDSLDSSYHFYFLDNTSMATLLVPTSLAAQFQNIRLPSVTNVRNELNIEGCPPVRQLAYTRCFSSLSESLLHSLLHGMCFKR